MWLSVIPEIVLPKAGSGLSQAGRGQIVPPSANLLRTYPSTLNPGLHLSNPSHYGN